MRSIKYSLLCCALLSVAGVVQLRAQDRIGCKDSPLTQPKSLARRAWHRVAPQCP